MPANLTPQYLEAEARYRAAKAVSEKLEALEEMMALLPKHKGTEKIQADIRRRISKLKSEARKKGKAAARHADPFALRREGAGQLVLVGSPNCGKSSLVARLTRARPEIAPYPFTTHRPVPGMMRFENVLLQLVDSPPVTAEFLEPGMKSLLHSADALVVVADLGAEDPLGPLEAVLTQLDRMQLTLEGSIEPVPAKGLKGALWVANKLDHPRAEENIELLRELVPRHWLAVSAQTGDGFVEFAREAFQIVKVIRIYTKPPGKKPDFDEPTVLKQGSTVLDAAAAIHRDFAHRLRYVRLWRERAGEEKTPPSGIKVDRDFLLADGDIVELHVERAP